MNWSDYSKFVGDVFGAPLAMEALLAFFFESTFIGLWIFGWDKLPKKIHCECIWIVSLEPPKRWASATTATPPATSSKPQLSGASTRPWPG